VTSETSVAPEPTVVSPAVHKRLMSGFPGYAFAMLVCFAVVGGIMLLSPSHTPNGIPPAVNYSIDLINARSTAPYPVYAPEGLGAKWVPTSSQLTGPVGKGGPVAWHLGFVTPRGQYTGLEQSNQAPAAFVARMTGHGVAKGSVLVGGVTWTEYQAGKKQNSLVRRLPDATIVISGSAGYPELETLAGSLQAPAHKP
jgi:Protein of unknown function (DUF4245)